MKPFLYKVADAFYAHYENNLYDHTFIFPNRRAGIFFQKHLAAIANQPLFSPRVITIQEFFESLSNYQLADSIELLVILYQQYNTIKPDSESFDEFLYWGEMLLSDFSDIDKHLADAEQLFRNIHNLKAMEDDAAYLTPEQIEAIQQFWTHFQPWEGNETKTQFLETWEILHDLYLGFRKALHEKGVAYEGMLFRDAHERIKAGVDDLPQMDNLVFVGLNALTPAETKVMYQLKERNIADFYWDYESPIIRDHKNRASYWINDNLELFPSQLTLAPNPATDPTDIRLIGVPSGVGQAKVSHQLLQELIEEKSISADNEGLNTAIVLADEQLLLPVLYSIPEEVDKINVTMGYSLQHSSIASFISAIATLQNNARKTGGKMGVYYKFILALLNHPLTALVERQAADQLKHYIQSRNRVLLTEEELHTTPFFQSIFTVVDHWQEAAPYLQNILSTLYQHLNKEEETTDDDLHRSRATDLESEFIVRYYQTITRLQESLSEQPDLAVETYFKLLRQLSQSISVNFSGEPLSGLQVMGILETRALDFENLIILSMNEGTFPLKNPTNSFIPYTLRKAFDLPTYEHQDSTYAYHFYRMIQRSKRVYMLYDTRTEEMQTGEVSRYFHQMKYLYDPHFNITEQTVHYNVSAPEVAPITVVKSEQVMAKLNRYRAGGDKNLSASNLNSYINCPLRFYFSAVEGLSEEDEVTESVESSVFGTIYHAVMQQLYDRHKGQIVQPDTLNALIKDHKQLTRMIEEQFSKHQFKEEAGKIRPLTGYYYLVGEVLRDLIEQTLQHDLQLTPFRYIGSEYEFNTQHRVNDQLTVNVKGSIDRIDESNDITRIIDYKSGKGELRFTSIEQLFDNSRNNRPYQILQVLFYSLFYRRGETAIAPAVYYLRNIFDENYSSGIMYDKHPVNDVSIILDEFEEQLNEVITELFDPDIPFAQTENEDNCTWCPFKEICRRKGSSW